MAGAAFCRRDGADYQGGRQHGGEACGRRVRVVFRCGLHQSAYDRYHRFERRSHIFEIDQRRHVLRKGNLGASGVFAEYVNNDLCYGQQYLHRRISGNGGQHPAVRRGSCAKTRRQRKNRRQFCGHDIQRAGFTEQGGRNHSNRQQQQGNMQYKAAGRQVYHS